MHAMEMLRKDHEQLRAHLQKLEDMLQLGTEGTPAVRERCGRLLKLLHNHLRRENDVVEACRSALTGEELDSLDAAHRGGPTELLDIYQTLRAPGSSWPWVEDVLTEWIRRMRRHLDDEEREVFPDLQYALKRQEYLEQELLGDAPFRYDEWQLPH